MTPADDLPLDDRAGELLAAWHEALLAGKEPTGADTPLPPEERAKLERMQACLVRLETARRTGPGQASAVPANGAATVGRFRLIRELGRGSYGIVFLARDPLLQREVAVKVPRPEALLDPELRRRFLREARAAAGLRHPHIASIHEAGEVDGICYIASAYCAGPNLGTWLKQQVNLVPPRVAAVLAASLADAVQHAHDRGVLHRDLKPTNILLESADSAAPQPLVADFGLAKLMEREEESTRSGAIVGTPCYMAPEQAEGGVRPVGPAADVYALGAILYEMLTDRPPFKGATVLETLDQVRLQEPMPPSRLHAQLPADLQTICLKCLRKEPGDRYAGAAALADDLRRFLADEPIQARPPSWRSLFAYWCRRPERVSQAGLVMLISGTALSLWVLICLPLMLLGVQPTERPGETALFVLSFLILCYLPLAALGWAVMSRQRAKHLGMGLALTIAWFLYFSGMMAAGMDGGGLYKDGSYAHVIPLYGLMVLIQIALLGIALYSHHWRHSRQMSRAEKIVTPHCPAGTGPQQ